MKVYLAGPMRGYPEFNFPAFHAAAERLRELGHEVFSPAEKDEADGFNPKTDEAKSLSHYMQDDLPAVCQSDAVFVLPGWSESQGARLEVHVAREIGIPVYDTLTMEPLGSTRQFESGATRDSDDGKLDYEGFLSPFVLERYATYMHSHRVQPDGTLRDSDNWQRGIPKGVYMKSLWRHHMEVWKEHRLYQDSYEELEEALCAVIFNAMGYLHEIVKTD